MEALGEGFGEAIGEGFGHDGVVVVVLCAEAVRDGAEAVTGGDGKGAEVVVQAGVGWRDEVGKRTARL